MIGTFFHSLSPISLWSCNIQLTCCSTDYLACLLLCLYKSQPVCESVFQTHLCLCSFLLGMYSCILHCLFLLQYTSINVFILLSSTVKQPIYNAWFSALPPSSPFQDFCTASLFSFATSVECLPIYFCISHCISLDFFNLIFFNWLTL